MTLKLQHVVSVEYARSFDDNRFKVNRAIVSYLGSDGYEYRKAFESKGNPFIPQSGTHKELNALKIQYRSA